MKIFNKIKPVSNYLIVAILLLFCNSCKKQNLTEKSNQWDIIKYKEYFIENNTWNIQAAGNQWSQSIFCDTLTGIMGWKWDFSGEDNMQNRNEIKTFPEIIFGKKPYSKYQSTTTFLPKKITVAEVHLRYDYILEAQGIFNLSTDITFSDSLNPGEKNIRAKMMIWLDYNNMIFQRPENLKTAMIGGCQYKIYVDTTYVGPEGKWNYIALLPDDLSSKGEINLKEFFDYFLSEGALKPQWYLSSIELGSEIASGKGKITFKKFEVF